MFRYILEIFCLTLFISEFKFPSGCCQLQKLKTFLFSFFSEGAALPEVSTEEEFLV